MTADSATLYGLTRCDTCTKARRWLERFGIPFTFVDYREQRVPPETLKAWAEQLGGFDALVNRQSTSWRELPPARKQPGSAPEYLLLIREHPTLVKRPLLVRGGTVTLGFTDSLYKRVFGI
jgi:Spx/MgsR family transcriptional regulator